MKHIPLRRYEIHLGGFYGLFQLFVLPLLASIFNTYLLHLPLWSLQFFVFALNFLCSGVIFHRFLLDNWDQALDTPWKTLQSAGFGLLIYYLGTAIVTTLIFLLRPDYVNLNNDSVAQLATEGRWLMLIAIVFMVPIAEELLFRGVLFRAVYDRNPLLAWICSIGCFAAVHVIGYIGQYDGILFFLAFLQYLPAGFSLCFAYHHSGTIVAPIVMHMFINLLAFIII